MRSPLIKKQVGFDIPDSFCELIKGTTLNYFQNQKQAQQFSHLCAQAVVSNKKLLRSIKNKTEKLSLEVFKMAKNNYPLPKLKDETIIKILLASRNLQKDLAAWGMVVAFADVYGEITNQVMDIFGRRKNLIHPVSYYLEILTNPNKLSQTALAYQEIRKSKNDKDVLNKYFWLDQGYIGRGLNAKQLKAIKLHKTEKESGTKMLEREILKELKLTKAEQNLLNIFRELVYIKSLRSDSRQALYVVANNIVDLLAARLKVQAKYLEALSTLELIAVIKGKTEILAGLAARWQRSLIIPLSLDNYKIISGNLQIEKFLQARIDVAQKQLEGIAELKGQVAQPGKACGKARLIFGPQHNSKVKKGDILVSVSTSPQLLPAMKLAAAFVTDMGGITSHAAIVSRELRTPCIVGTKIATKILHDGDLVEVDANKGIIKILK
ncbi:MAG: hypothetical protein HY931_02645 [Candidatus Falkowbacteria bacterium]|nr:MAG: hypothetical protein HY931_02645 [Candidatus Falkowbacteria bacterium]